MSHYFFIIFLVLYEFTVYMANDLIMPAMLNVVHEFQSNEVYIPFSMSLYILGGTVLPFFVGPLSDRIGRKTTMLWGCQFFAICTVVIILSPSIPFFMTARFFQGMGLAFITVCGYASVQELFEEKKAVRVIAWMTSVAVTAPIIGPILGGMVVDLFSWRWIFVFTLGLTALSYWGIWRYMPETLPKTARAQSKQASFSKLLHGFSLIPTLKAYRKLITSPKLALGGLLSGLVASPVLCWIACSPVILFKNGKIEPYLYGAVQIPIFGCFIVGNMILRKLTFRRSLTHIILLGFPFYIIGLTGMLIFTSLIPDSYWSLIIPLSIAGIGHGMISAPITRQALFSTPEAKGITSAVFNFLSMYTQIASISAVPLAFKSHNLEFAQYCFGFALLTSVTLFFFLRSPSDNSDYVSGVEAKV